MTYMTDCVTCLVRLDLQCSNSSCFRYHWSRTAQVAIAFAHFAAATGKGCYRAAAEDILRAISILPWASLADCPNPSCTGGLNIQIYIHKSPTSSTHTEYLIYYLYIYMFRDKHGKVVMKVTQKEETPTDT